MAAERIIGIDFGTSTSVMRVKRYRDGVPIGDGERLDTKCVVFNGTYPTVPTLIQKVGENTYYGYDAQVGKKNAVLYQSFKVDLESADNGKRETARCLTQEFLTYLAGVYKAQSEGGHLGDADDRERTIISYPVKWSRETKAFMVEAARKAGFANVEGMDEAQAAIHAVTLQSEDYLRKQGYLKTNVPATILLIDMGAGTTDLVLCRYTPGEQQKTEILSTWPREGDVLFGGREVEELLRNYVRERLPENMADMVLKKCGADKFKAWKETVVSPALSRGEKVDGFADLDMIVELLDIDMEDYDMTRLAFEECAKDYLARFPHLVQGCIGAASIKKEEVDLVILTGGHSQWYFVKKLLTGEKPEFCSGLLPRIERDKGRVIPVSRPQETVALGLVYLPMSAKPEQPEQTVKKKEAPTVKRQNVEIKREEKPGGPEASEEQKKRTLAGELKKRVAILPAKTGRGFRIAALDASGRIRTVAVLYDKNGVREVMEPGLDAWEQAVLFGTQEPELVERAVEEIKNYKRFGGMVVKGQEKWSDVIAVAGETKLDSLHPPFGLRKDGTVITLELYKNIQNSLYNRRLVDILSTWKDIVSIQGGENWLVGWNRNGGIRLLSNFEDGWQSPKERYAQQAAKVELDRSSAVILKKDGTVEIICVGYPLDKKGNANLASAVKQWRNIVAISDGITAIGGLCKDGTVMAAGVNADIPGQEEIHKWENIKAIEVSGGFIGLKNDGIVVSAGDWTPSTANWRSIMSLTSSFSFAHISGNEFCVVGIKENGQLIYSVVFAVENMGSLFSKKQAGRAEKADRVLDWKLLL